MMGYPNQSAAAHAKPIVDWPDELVDLYRASYRGHVQLAFLMLGSRHEAEEIVQDAVVELGSRWESVQSPAAYLRRSVVNGAIGLLRHRKVVERHRTDPPPPHAPDHLVELRDALLRLPARQRAAIALRFVEGLDDVDIARLLDCRRSTVRSLVSRGLTTLRLEVPK